MDFKLFLFILVTHFLGDFVLQTNWQAKNKYNNNKALGYHCLTYSLVWVTMSYVALENLPKSLLFGIITFLCHFITDYNTSKLCKKFFDNKDTHNGFIVIGFDQILHYLQLYLTFILISQI